MELRTIEQIRERLREIRATGVTWRNPVWAQEFPGVRRGTLNRICKHDDYEPLENRVREPLGLPKLVRVEEWEGYKIRHERLVKPNKGKALKEKQVRCPNCAHVFAERGNMVGVLIVKSE